MRGLASGTGLMQARTDQYNYRRAIGALGVTVALVASGCGSGGGADGSDFPVVKVATINVLSFAPFFIAEAEGFYEEQGLAVELIQVESSGTAVAATLNGDLDVLSGTMSAGVINAIAGGERLQIVADKGNFASDSCSYVAMMGPAELFNADGSVDPEQVRGATIGGIRDGSLSSGLFLDQFLKSIGLSSDDVVTQDVSRPALAESIEGGSIDFAYTGEPWVTRVVDEGNPIVAAGQDVLAGYQFGYVSYGPRLLDDEDLGNRFMAAYLQGVRQYNQGKTDRNLEIVTLATGLEDDLLRRACWPDIRADGAYEAAQLVPAIEWGFETGIVDRLVSADELVDGRFAAHANEKLGSG